MKKDTKKPGRKLDKVQATGESERKKEREKKKKTSRGEHAGWERASVVGIVSHNKKLVGLKRKVCRLGMKLYVAVVYRKIFP